MKMMLGLLSAPRTDPEKIRPIVNTAKAGKIRLNPRRFLPTFTFLQVGIRAIEFQALPGLEARALRAKTMRRASLPGPGGQVLLPPRTGFVRCRGARPGARAARPILRKQSRISGQNSFPADAFSAQSRQRRDFRATTLLLSRKGSHKSEGGRARRFH